MGFCNPVTGELNVTKYGNPIPWVGVYIAAASFLCAAAMAFDLFSGFRRRRLWLPPKLFSLNATTLTLLSVATKLSTDLSAAMPSPTEQLTKLSGTALLCTAMANTIASLGESDVRSNVVAVGILVVTVIIDVCIQIGTGVIYVLVPEHITMVILMVVLLVILISSPETLNSTKARLEDDYNRMDQRLAAVTTGDSNDIYSLAGLRRFLKKHWLLAHTCSPGYGRVPPYVPVGVLCLVVTSVLTEAMVRGLVIKDSNLEFCRGMKKSDYHWSITWILIAQAAAVVIGTVAPVCRWFTAVKGRFSRDWSRFAEFSVRILDLPEALIRIMRPSPSVVVARLRNKHGFRWALKSRGKLGLDPLNRCRFALLTVLAVGFCGVILVIFSVCLFSFLMVNLLQKGRRLFSKMESPLPSQDNQEEEELQTFHLHMDWEEDFVNQLTTSELRNMETCLYTGRKTQVRDLVELLGSHSTVSEGFKGVAEFDSDTFPSFGREPPNYWAIPVVVLATIAAALPGIDPNPVKSLLHAVTAGLRFIELIERNMAETGPERKWDGEYTNAAIRECEEWLHRCLTRSTSLDNTYGMMFIWELEHHARERVPESRGEEAANCMYRVCATIRQDYDAGKYRTDNDLFSWLRRVIADILGACLTNLPRAIFLEFQNSKIESRKRRVRDVVRSLGEAEDILKFLEDRYDSVRFSPAADAQFIDSWRHRRHEMYL